MKVAGVEIVLCEVLPHKGGPDEQLNIVGSRQYHLGNPMYVP